MHIQRTGRDPANRYEKQMKEAHNMKTVLKAMPHVFISEESIGEVYIAFYIYLKSSVGQERKIGGKVML